jgi:inner membrane protein
MDSLTHLAIGACIGDLFLGKKIGKRAMLYGAIAASLPDIDFVASFWLDPADDLLAHRGFTHSLLFAILVVAILAFFFRHRHSAQHIPIKTWLIFMAVEIASHLFLDAFNAYGIGWFEPFSHTRISFNTIFVADPFFSIGPAIAAMALLILNRHSSKRRKWAKAGLIFCSFYLVYCTYNKSRIDVHTRYALIQKSIHYNRYFTTPTPFNNWLWCLVAEADSGFYIGYRSVFDRNDHINFKFFSRNEELIKPFMDRHDVQQLIWFSQGYYTIENSPHGVVFNDLRFGQMMAWQNPDAHFVFHYYLQDPDANHLVVQRGRFANWNRETVRAFVKRIEGD